MKLIGYARVSTKQQTTDRQQDDLLAAGVRRDDLYVDHGVSGARASRPEFVILRWPLFMEATRSLWQR